MGEHGEYVAIALANASGRTAKLRAATISLVGERGRVLRTREDIVVVIYEVAGGSDRHESAESLRIQLAKSLADQTVSAGLGGLRRTPSGAYATALQAQQALLLGRPSAGDGRTTSFEELGPYSFILGQPIRDIRTYCQRVLGPLADGECEHDALLATLEVFIRSRNINVVARTLRLHRNSVRKRLKRIAAATGADLTDPDTRLAMHMAILGRRALARLSHSARIQPDEDLPTMNIATGRTLLGRTG